MVSPARYIQLPTTPCPLLLCRALKIINAWMSPSSACVLQSCIASLHHTIHCIKPIFVLVPPLCRVHLMGTWSRVHQDKCIVAFIICSLSQMKYHRWCNGWKLRIDIVKTFRRWHPEPSSNRAMRRWGDIRPPSAQRQCRAHHASVLQQLRDNCFPFAKPH